MRTAGPVSVHKGNPGLNLNGWSEGRPGALRGMVSALSGHARQQAHPPGRAPGNLHTIRPMATRNRMPPAVVPGMTTHPRREQASHVRPGRTHPWQVPQHEPSHRRHWASDLRSPVTGAARLGHKDASLTLRVYAHMWPDARDAGRGAVESAFLHAGLHADGKVRRA